MSLLTVVIILLIWAAVGLSENLKRQQPPIEDMEKHLKKVMSANTIKERRKIR